VYSKITSPSNKIYIGQSVDIKKRWRAHKTKSHKGKLRNSFLKHGVENHLFEVIELCDISDLNNKERYYQDLYDSTSFKGLNLRATSSNDKSGYLSEETKSKLIGRICSAEHIRKSSESRRGMKHSEEHKLKIGLSSKGRKHSEETKIKLSKLKTGLTYSKETKAKVGLSSSIRNSGSGNPKSRKVINMITSEVFLTIKDAAKAIGIKDKLLAEKLRRNTAYVLNIKYYE
jgi:group I intron endonuclease